MRSLATRHILSGRSLSGVSFSGLSLPGIIAAIGLGCFALAGTAQADTLSVQPEQLNISQVNPVSTLLLRNDGDEERTVQLEIKEWQQVGGSDQLLQSGRLLVHPDNVRLKPGDSARVKVALKLSGPRWEEQAFQVLLTEVPRIPDLGSSEAQSTQHRMRRRSSVPVFLLPPGTVNPRISWEVIRHADGTVMLKASNSGRAHVQLNSASLAGPNGQRIDMQNLSSVILPGGSRSWRLMETATGGLWQLSADTSKGLMQAELELEPGLAASSSLTLAD